MGQEDSQISVVKSIKMATELLLIDTDVLIDYSRGIEKIWSLTTYLQLVLLPSLN